MKDLLLQPLADAFLEVGVFVALMLAIFGYLQHRHGHALTGFLARHARTGPLVGAMLGVVPGCGGAIVVVPLYLRGTVSFGTVVAALVATMGDASFVLIATNPRLALVVHLLLLGCGVVTGTIVDALGIAPRVRGPAAVSGAPAGDGPARRVTPAATVPATMAVVRVDRVTAGPGAGADDRRHLRRLAIAPAALSIAVRQPLPVAFWGLWAMGLCLAIPVAMQLTDGPALTPLFAGVDPYRLLGVTGTSVCLAVYLRRPTLGDDTMATVAAQQASMVGMLRHAAQETSFVVTWVAAAYVVTTWLIQGAGLDLAALAGVVGLGGVLVGALIGLIPGCAPQVLLTGLYATGALPLPTLLANAASQDGDALLPLLLLDRRAALWGTVISTVPGLALGAGWLLLASGS